MNYIRNYYKLIVFDVFKIRAKFINTDFYIIIKKMVAELYNIFGDYDKIVKCDAELYNSIIIIRKNEFFD